MNFLNIIMTNLKKKVNRFAFFALSAIIKEKGSECLSNFNLFFLLFIGLFLAIAIVFIVLYFFKNKAAPANTAAAQSGAKEQEVYRFADAFETVNLLGKTPSQTDVNENYFTEKGMWQVLAFDTLLFQKEAYGWIYFSGEGQLADTVYVNSKQMNFKQCREALTARYGEPASEWETPYVEVNGGAQSGCRFQSEELLIELTHGSEREYIELQIQNSKC